MEKIECKTREEWLKERKRFVMATDVAPILGWDKRRTALDVFVSKVTSSADDFNNDQMLAGRCVEDGIARIYGEKTDRPVFNTGDFTIFVHSQIPWLGATLDRLTDRVSGFDPMHIPLELKLVGAYAMHDWDDGLPVGVDIQLQIQQACSGASWGAFCALLGGTDIRYGDVDFNTEFFDSAVPLLEQFHQAVLKNEPPPVQTCRDLRPTKALYPADSGETIQLGENILTLVKSLEGVKDDLKEMEFRKDELEARIREAMGSATFANLPDGTVLSLKTTNKKGYTVNFKPTSYRTLRHK